MVGASGVVVWWFRLIDLCCSGVLVRCSFVWFLYCAIGFV